MSEPTQSLLGALTILALLALAIVFWPHPAYSQPGTFTCEVRRIHDGDTFTCSNGTRVRLAAIDAPEMGACPSGRRCASGSGPVSRGTLNAMAIGRRLRCEPNGTSYDRVTAFCIAPGGHDLSCMMLRTGQAVYLPRFDPARRLRMCMR